MSRNNVSDNFEACYLNENGARKAFRNPNVPDIIKSQDFEKCVKYMAHLIFSKNEHVLLAYGFNYDDMLSIVGTWALQFFNYEVDCKTTKDTYYLVMNFVSQKAINFLVSLNRKFRISESYIDIHLADLPQVQNLSWYHDFEVPVVVVSEEDELATIKETAKERKDKIEVMRKKLDADIDLYRDRLAELATSKIIDFQVRKKARQRCRKYNIDYIAWAKAQIALRNLNEADFVLV